MAHGGHREGGKVGIVLGWRDEPSLASENCPLPAPRWAIAPPPANLNDSPDSRLLIPDSRPMPIRFVCNHCGQKLSVGSHKAGQKANCPRCKESVRVPGDTNKPKAALAASMLVINDPADEAPSTGTMHQE